jgi:hypothetical protein
MQELLHQRTAWDQLLLGAASAAVTDGTSLTTHELLKFQILEQPLVKGSGSGAHEVPHARPSSGASAASGGNHSMANSGAIPQLHCKGGSSSTTGNSAPLATAISIQSSITQSSTTSGGVDRMLVVHRAFTMLASRCMNPDPALRPSFAEIVKKVDFMRRALANATGTALSQ